MIPSVIDMAVSEILAVMSPTSLNISYFAAKKQYRASALKSGGKGWLNGYGSTPTVALTELRKAMTDDPDT